jgi:hypothetical protein
VFAGNGTSLDLYHADRKPWALGLSDLTKPVDLTE